MVEAHGLLGIESGRVAGVWAMVDWLGLLSQAGALVLASFGPSSPPRSSGPDPDMGGCSNTPPDPTLRIDLVNRAPRHVLDPDHTTAGHGTPRGRRVPVVQCFSALESGAFGPTAPGRAGRLMGAAKRG